MHGPGPGAPGATGGPGSPGGPGVPGAPGAVTTFVWSEDLPRYNFGPTHPMAPVRLELTRDLVRALELPWLREAPVARVDDATLELVHDRDYIAAVRAASAGEPNPAFGLGTDDIPIFSEIHSAAARIVGSTLAGAQAVWHGTTSRAVSIAGGMHHAMPRRASGFCVYNDLAIAIRWMLAQGAERIVYLDLDAHHGDGVQQVFWDDPRVLTISVHESPVTLFPGTGWVDETGGPEAEGCAVNLPLPAGTGGAAWLRAVEAVAVPLIGEFAPDVVVSQHGCDSHTNDQLTHLRVSVEAQLAAARLVRDLADRHTQGRWLATGGGGYALLEVVPRVWAGLTAISAGSDPDPKGRLPQSWIDAVARRHHLPAPEHWGDGDPVTLRRFSDGYDPGNDVDRAIMATRAAVFPSHGLDPLW